LLKIPFQESHLLLLRLRITVSDHIVVLLLDLVQLNFQLNDLLTAILKITHEGFLDTVKLRKLDIDSFACPFKVLSTLRQVLPTFDTSRCDSEGALMGKLERGSSTYTNTIKADLELFIDAFQTVDRCVQASDLIILHLYLLLEIRYLALVRFTLGSVLGFQFVL
jgi:hypothetical protein